LSVFGPATHAERDLTVTGILKAASGGDLESARVILDLKPELVNAVGPGGLTPLHVATWPGGLDGQVSYYGDYAGIVELLIARGADVNTADSVRSMTPLHTVTLWTPGGSGGGRVTVNVTINGVPYREHAIEMQNRSLRALLQKNPSINARTSTGYTPLHCAAKNGYAEMVRLLLSHGADPTLKTADGYTALDLARDSNSSEAVSILSNR